MTKEQAIRIIKMHCYFANLVPDAKKALDMAIDALEQQPGDDEMIITMKKGTLKCSGHGYVTYNKDWFRKHFATEVKIMTGYDGYIKQPTSDDCVSRAEVFEIMGNLMSIPYDFDRPINDDDVSESMDKIKALPPVTSTRKVGKWIRVDHTKVKCSNCDITHLIAQYPHGVIDYCPNCGSYNQSIVENER